MQDSSVVMQCGFVITKCLLLGWDQCTIYFILEKVTKYNVHIILLFISAYSGESTTDEPATTSSVTTPWVPAGMYDMIHFSLQSRTKVVGTTKSFVVMI